jgi:hypothetical protein
METQGTQLKVGVGDEVIVQDRDLFGEGELWSGRVEDVVRFDFPYERASFLVRSDEDGSDQWIDDLQIVCYADDARELLDVRFEVLS